MFIYGLLADYSYSHLLRWHDAGTQWHASFLGKKCQPRMVSHRQAAECFRHHFILLLLVVIIIIIIC